jgi:hypothetical protein
MSVFQQSGEYSPARQSLWPGCSGPLVERFHRTLKDECFSLAYRRTPYDSVKALQADLDAFIAFHNASWAHHVYRTQGRTPLPTCADHLGARMSAYWPPDPET